jgi:hypothetical protein
MAVIAKISNSKSSSAALSYGLGLGDKKLKNATREWLESQGIDTSHLHQRAVAMSGTNGILPDIAEAQFKAVRQQFHKDTASNQALRVVQSFSEDELSASNPAHWQKANDLGIKLAQELYPNNQTAVYTHIDGENHVLHNHIVINKVDLNGQKIHEKPGQTVKKARVINDKIAVEQGWQILDKPIEAVSQAEKHFGADSWRAQIKKAVDTIMENGQANDFDSFAKKLLESHITVTERGKNLTYSMDVNGQERRVRGNKLGTDYNKEAISNELERQATTRGQQSVELTDEIEQREQEFEQRKSETQGSIRTSNREFTSYHEAVQRSGKRKPEIKQRESKINTAITRISDSIQGIRRRIQQEINEFKNWFDKQIEEFKEEQEPITKEAPIEVEVEPKSSVDNQPEMSEEDLAYLASMEEQGYDW